MALDFGVNVDPTDIKDLAKVEATLNSMGITMAKVVDVTSKLNKNMNTTKQVVKILGTELVTTASGIQDFEKIVTLTLNKTKKGFGVQGRVIGSYSKDTVEKLKQISDKFDAMNTNLGSKNPLTGLKTSNEDVRKLSRINNLISNIFSTSKLSMQEAETLYGDVFSQPVIDFTTLNKEQQKFVLGVIKIKNLQEQIDKRETIAREKRLKANQKAFDNFYRLSKASYFTGHKDSIVNAVSTNLKEPLNEQQGLALNRMIIGLQNTFAKSKVTFSELSGMITDVFVNKQTDVTTYAAKLQNVAKGLVRIFEWQQKLNAISNKKETKILDSNARDNDANLVKTTMYTKVFDVFNKLDINSKISAMSKLNTIMNQIRSGKLTVAEFNAVTQAVDNNVVHMQKFTKAQMQAAIALQRFYAILGQSSKGKLTNLFGSFNFMSRIFQLQLIHRLFGMILTSGQNAIKVISDTDVNIGKIKTITQDVRKSTHEWRKELIQVSNLTGVDLVETSSSAYNLFSNNIAKSSEALKVLNTALTFSKVTGSTATDSVNLISFAINAFKLSAADAEYVAAIFFKTIDLGNVTAEQMAQSFGLIAPLAKQVGLTFTELNAAIVTITRQGLEFDSSATLVRNLLKELVAPTEGLKEKFREWGVVNGEAAIKTFGFSGVLEKFLAIMKEGGSPALAQVTDDLRSLIAIPSLSGGGNLQIFKESLDKLNDSVSTYYRAAQSVREQSTFIVQMFGTNLSNSISKTTSAIMDLMATGIDSFLGRTLLDVLKIAAAEFEVAANATNALFIALGKITGMNDLEGSLFGTLSERFEETNKYLREYIELNTRAKVTRIITDDPTLKNKQNTITNLKKDLQDSARELAQFTKVTDSILTTLTDISKFKDYDQFLEKNKERMDSLIEASLKYSETIKNNFSKRFIDVNLDKSDMISKLQKSLELIPTLQKEGIQFFNNRNIEEARRKFETIEDIVSNINNELRRSANDSIKRINDVQIKMSQNEFERKLRGKNKNAQTTLIQGRVNELIGEAFGTENIEEARRLLDEAENLASRIYSDKTKSKGSQADRIIDQVQQAQIERENLNLRFVQTNMFNELELANQRLIIEDNYLSRERQINDLVVQRVDLQKQIEQSQLNMVNSHDEIIKRLEAEMRILIATRQFRPASTNPTSIEPGHGLGFAVGGLIGGPMGVDNQLIRVSGNEVVMNARASRAWYPVLAAMNSGMKPRGYATGGPVTNIGDINVNMSATESKEQDVRAFGYKLRREIKRGNVRLS